MSKPLWEVSPKWSWATLDDIADWASGGTPKSGEKRYYDGDISWLVIGDLNDGLVTTSQKKITKLGLENSSAKMVSVGAILVAMYGSIGKLGIAGIECATNQAIAFTKKDSIKVLPKYLYYYIYCARPKLFEIGKGGAQQNISQTVLKEFPICIAPLNEQKRIVEKLEKLLGKVEAVQARLDKIPAILKRFRQAVLAAAFSGKLTTDWRKENPNIKNASILLKDIEVIRLQNASTNKEKLQIQEVFLIELLKSDELDLPDTWISCSIGHIGTVSNGSTPSRKVSEYWNGNIHWVSSGEVRNNIISDTKEFITQKGFENSSVKLLPKGTILLAMIGEGKTRGQTAILDIEATINQNSAAIVINHGLVTSNYLWSWFKFQYETTREQGSGSGPQALNCQRVRELSFILPPLEEQKEIVRRVEDLFKFADQIEARYKRARSYTDKITQSILAKAFRGELVPQDENDEPASVLLEIIRQAKNDISPKRNQPNKNN